MRYDISIANCGPELLLKLRRQLRTERLGEDLSEGMRAIHDLADSMGLSPVGAPATTYHGRLDAAVVEAEFSLPVDPDSVAGYATDIWIHRRPSHSYAYTTHHGDHETIEAGYRALSDWINAAGLRAASPPTEIHLVRREHVANASDLRTEIRVPIHRPGSAARQPEVAESSGTQRKPDKRPHQF